MYALNLKYHSCHPRFLTAESWWLIQPGVKDVRRGLRDELLPLPRTVLAAVSGLVWSECAVC